MNALEINTVVEHFVCKIFQQAAKDLSVPVIVLAPADANRVNHAVCELRQVLTHFVESARGTLH